MLIVHSVSNLPPYEKILSPLFLIFADVNECLDPVSPCAATQMCVNLFGSFVCLDGGGNNLLSGESQIEDLQSRSKAIDDDTTLTMAHVVMHPTAVCFVTVQCPVMFQTNQGRR